MEADTRLRASAWEFGHRIFHRGYIVLVGIAGGTLGAYNEFFGAVKLSPEQSWAIAGVSLLIAAFWAFHDLRVERDERIVGLEAEAEQSTGGSSDSRYAALSDLLGESLTVGVDLSQKGDWPLLEAWKAHTRDLVAGAYGAGEAAHAFTPELKAPKIHRGSISAAMLERPPPLGDTINSVKALIGRMSSLAIRADFDPAEQTVFDPDAYRSEFARSTEETPSGIWTCPWCGWEADHSHASDCGDCQAEKTGDLVYKRPDQPVSTI